MNLTSLKARNKTWSYFSHSMFSDHVYARPPLAKRSLALDAEFLSLIDMHCVVPENIHAHPRKVNENSKEEEGFKSPFF